MDEDKTKADARAKADAEIDADKPRYAAELKKLGAKEFTAVKELVNAEDRRRGEPSDDQKEFRRKLASMTPFEFEQYKATWPDRAR